jgi:hypothetical protein
MVHDMTLDDGYLSQREMLERDRERDRAEAKAAWLERELTESVEAVEAHWRSTFAQSAQHWTARQHWGSHG